MIVLLCILSTPHLYAASGGQERREQAEHVLLVSACGTTRTAATVHPARTLPWICAGAVFSAFGAVSSDFRAVVTQDFEPRELLSSVPFVDRALTQTIE